MKSATTKMSSKGQVVIPEVIRKELGLEAGTQFVVIGDGDAVILKKVQVPTMEDFDRLMAKAKRAAKESGMKPSDITKAIREDRVERAKRKKKTGK